MGEGIVLNVQDPGGQPNDVDGIGGPGGQLPPGPGQTAPPAGTGTGLVLPEVFLRGIISAPFNVANAAFGECCPPLKEEELQAGILPIQMWIQEATAEMAIDKPNRLMALMWLGSVMIPRGLAVIGNKETKKPKQRKQPQEQQQGATATPALADDIQPEGGEIEIADGIIIPREER